MKVPENMHRKEAEKEARKASDLYSSEGYRKKIEQETKRIKSEVFRGLKEYYRDKPNGIKENAKLSPHERIYLFISSSVPTGTLRNYMAGIDAAQDPNIIVVMRGFIGGMKYVRPTLEFTHALLKKNTSCNLPEQCELYAVNFEIDPLLFRRYGINRVPAVVYVPDIDVEDPAGSEGLEDNAKVSDYHLFYGDVSLDYAIERINEKARSSSLEDLARVMRKGFYR
jgi:conjugal transfer pilus assembly protein TrbC